jgi:diguanylate cyclase (GGDEF)-like protein
LAARNFWKILLNWFRLFPMDPEDLGFRPQLHTALVEELYKQSWPALVTLSAVVVLLRIIADNAISATPLLHWIFKAMVLVVIVRIAWLGFVFFFPGRCPSASGKHGAFIAGTTLTSACFVALNVAVFPRLGPFPLALVCICQAGVSTTAMATMSASPLAYALYMPPMIGSLAVMAIAHPLPVLGPVFILLLLVFIFAQLSINLSVHRTLRDNVLLRLKLRDMALMDVLTGLRNRRYLQEFLAEEILRVQRSWHPDSLARGVAPRSLALIMLDMDHFKAVNDTFGHAAGDEVLKQLASVLKETIRKPDLVVRWGGEEFVILVQDVSRAMPMIAAERIREALETHEFSLPSGEMLRKTCSLGYALYPFLQEQPEQLGWEQVLNLADGALYQAKQSGRNCVMGVVPGGASPHLISEALSFVDKGLQGALASDLLRLVRPEALGPDRVKILELR